MVRICSLLPSATEIVCALGLRDDLVAITHECDYPPEIAGLPPVTSNAVDSAGMSSAEIDAAIRQALVNLSTIYHLDRNRLCELRPDLILTQELCEVCAVSFERVEEAAHALCPGAKVLSLEPHSLHGILESINQVASAAGAESGAAKLLAGLRSRIQSVEFVVHRSITRPRILTVEWLDPLFVGGHWVPEMVEIAGGQDVLGKPGGRSRRVTWAEAAEAAPEIVILMPCGFDLDRTVTEFSLLDLPQEWRSLPAVRDRKVYAVDGSAYFNRPGPRTVDGVEILARILHPGRFGPPGGCEAVQVA
jgi:iron complex transport system substrate-binding protein